MTQGSLEDFCIPVPGISVPSQRLLEREAGQVLLAVSSLLATSVPPTGPALSAGLAPAAGLRAKGSRWAVPTLSPNLH